MSTLRNGALRLSRTGGILETIWNVSFFLLMLSVICFGNTKSGTNYYYYALDRSTGYHHFSSTYEEHNRFLGEQNDE